MPHEPDIDVLHIGCFWEVGVNSTQKCNDYQKCSTSSHKSIAKAISVRLDKQSYVSKKPKYKRRHES